MKIIKTIINVLSTLIIVVGGIFLGLYILGFKPYVVLSGSMEPTIKTGSLCIINQNIKYDDIKEKDIIAFRFNDGTLVTHRVYKKTKNGLTTKGDNNKNTDKNIITKNNYVGKNIFWIPKAGYVVGLVQSTKGKIIFITIIVLLLVSGFLFGDDNKKDKEQKEKEKETNK